MRRANPNPNPNPNRNQVRKHIISCGEMQLPTELLALAINLAFDPQAAEVLGDAGALRHCLERLLQTQVHYCLGIKEWV